jgi:hypothetical protein
MTGEGEPERVHGGLASGSLFTVFDVKPGSGSPLSPPDDRPDAEPVAVITDGFWHRRFAADSRTVGRSILLDGNAYTIVGVRAARPPLWTAICRSPTSRRSTTRWTSPWPRRGSRC